MSLPFQGWLAQCPLPQDGLRHGAADTGCPLSACDGCPFSQLVKLGIQSAYISKGLVPENMATTQLLFQPCAQATSNELLS